MTEGKRLSDEVQRISAEAADEAAARVKVSKYCCGPELLICLWLVRLVWSARCSVLLLQVEAELQSKLALEQELRQQLDEAASEKAELVQQVQDVKAMHEREAAMRASVCARVQCTTRTCCLTVAHHGSTCLLLVGACSLTTAQCTVSITFGVCLYAGGS